MSERLLIAIIVAGLGCRDAERAKRPPGPTQGEAAETADPPPRPVLAPIGPGIDPVGVAVDETFQAEPRDSAWADSTEREIRRRAPDAVDVTCRRSQCRFTLTLDSTDELATTADRLGAKTSIGGLARSVELAIPAPYPGGGVIVRGYARFDRPEAGEPN